MSKLIVLSTGGTGGHVFPAVSLAEELTRRGYQLLWCTDHRGEKYIPSLAGEKLVFYITKTDGILGKAKQLFTLAFAGLKIVKQFLRKKPDLVIGFGGYTSAPVVLAAKLLKIPIILHEQNAVLGKVNRWMLKYAKIMALGFENTEKAPRGDNIIYVGNPVRPIILEVGHQDYPLIKDKLTILIVGGSQGAAFLSHIVPQAISLLPSDIQQRLEIIQQARQELVESTQISYKKLNIEAMVKPFFINMEEIYKKAHLVICRAGAMTVTELLNACRPALFIPLPSALDNHQYFNAKEAVTLGGGWIFEEYQTNPQKLADFIVDISHHPQKLQDAALTLKKKTLPNSTVILANCVENLLPKEKDIHNNLLV